LKYVTYDEMARRKWCPLLKNLSDHRVRSSATATVHAQRLVRFRNPLTVIVKVESRDLAGDLDIDAALRNEWKGMDLAGATRAIDINVAQARATFIAMIQSTDLGKATILPAESGWMQRHPHDPCLMSSYDNGENNKMKRNGDASHLR
jgi:hypothetical protein